MGRKRIVRSESEERALIDDRKKRKIEQQRSRRALQREVGEPGPSSQNNKNNQTPEERDERLRKDRDRKAKERGAESDSQRDKRLQNDKNCKSVKREAETLSENEERLEKDRRYHQRVLEAESSEDRQNRLAQLRQNYLQTPEISQRKRAARQNESQADRQIRLQKNKDRQVKKNLEDPKYSTDINIITQHYIGKMDAKCKECNANHFEVETHDNNSSFSSCCEKGKVVIPPQNNFPDMLKNLFTNEDNRSKEFKNNIRGYNRSLSFASIITKEIRFNGGGPYTYRQMGEFQKKFNASANPDPEELASYGQLFMVESDEATGIRHNIMSHLNKDLLKELDQEMRQTNPFAQSYKMFKDEIAEADKGAKQNRTAAPEFKLLFCLKDHLDKRRFNPPRVNEVAVVFEQGVDGEVPRYELCVNEIGKKLITLKQTHQSAEPLLFALFYPTGQLGWHPKYEYNGKKITCAEYVKFKLFDRYESDSTFCPVLYGGKLFQEWIVTQYINIDRDRLDYIKNNVSEHLAENYDYLEEYLSEKSAETGMEIGKKFVLPSSYTGSPRYMTNAYDDALTLTKTYGKPDLFITMTCNPNWKEITENLKQGQVPADRPDLVARVFRIKYKEMIDYICKSQLYGKVKAHTGSIEFQKRGLPHLHLLLILDKATKLDSPEVIDKVIQAEIPDITTDPELHRIITTNNIHQCQKLDKNGKVYKKFPCIENSESCSKKFPKPFLEETEVKTGGYARYRRRNNGVTFIAPDGQVLDNRHVVSFTPQLSKKFNCHINVEHVADIEVVKYLHKYVFKGVDQALIERVSKDGSSNQLIYDEIQKYIECRYLSAPEAVWRTLGYEIIVKSHTVERLEIHEEGKQFIFFKKTDTKERIETLKRDKKSKLMAFFELNIRESTDLLYEEISKNYIHLGQKSHVLEKALIPLQDSR